MKGTCRWSEPGQKLIAHAPRAGQHIASGCRVFPTRFYFPRNCHKAGKIFSALRSLGDVIVIAPFAPSLTCETCSATFAPWQKRISPLRAHRAGPKQTVPLHLSL